jgi:hypothetical protein
MGAIARVQGALPFVPARGRADFAEGEMSWWAFHIGAGTRGKQIKEWHRQDNRTREGARFQLANKDCVSLLPKLVELSFDCKPPCAHINRGPAIAFIIELCIWHSPILLD